MSGERFTYASEANSPWFLPNPEKIPPEKLTPADLTGVWTRRWDGYSYTDATRVWPLTEEMQMARINNHALVEALEEHRTHLAFSTGQSFPADYPGLPYFTHRDETIFRAERPKNGNKEWYQHRLRLATPIPGEPHDGNLNGMAVFATIVHDPKTGNPNMNYLMDIAKSQLQLLGIDKPVIITL